MPVVVRLHPLASAEGAEATAKYEQVGSSTAARIESELDAALDLIEQAPERWPMFFRKYRRVVLHKFPYSVVYRVNPSDPSDAEVVAIAHQKRRVGYWSRR